MKPVNGNICMLSPFSGHLAPLLGIPFKRGQSTTLLGQNLQKEVLQKGPVPACSHLRTGLPTAVVAVEAGGAKVHMLFIKQNPQMKQLISA